MKPALLLAAWEEASAAPPVVRPAVLVHWAGLMPDLDAALDLGVGECAALAVQAHAAAFGREVQGVVPCSCCGELLEAQVELPEPAIVGSAVEQVGDFTVQAPTMRDLLDATAVAADARDFLFSRCVRRGDGSSAVPAELSLEAQEAVDSIAHRLAGLAVQVLLMRCPACGNDVRAALDPGALLWDQVDAAAPALVEDVATLARAFGWSEEAVLAMSPARRNAYLEQAKR